MKKSTYFILTILILVLTTTILFGCVSSNLREKTVINNLKNEYQYTVKNITNCAITDGWNIPDEDGNAPAQLGTMLYATKDPIIEEETGAQRGYEHEIWIIYAKNYTSAGWVENKAKALAKETGYNVYRKNRVVLYGDFETVRLVKSA